MKLIPALLMLVVLSTKLFSQEPVTIYLDEYGFPLDNRAEAVSYLEVSADAFPGHYRVREFYMSDTLKQTGPYSDEDLFMRNGTFICFYPNGKIKSEEYYEANTRTGTAKYWHANGQLKQICSYHFLITRIDAFYDSLGNPMVENGNGTYFLEEEDPFETQPVTLKGPVKSGFKHGQFTGYLSDGTVYCKEEYEDGDLIQGVSFKAGKEIPYKIVMDQGFYSRWMEHLRKNLRYPASARRTGVDGTVWVRLVLNEDYSVKKSMLLKRVSPDIDKETLRVLLDTGFKYGPIVKRGQLYQGAVFLAPIRFKLN